MRFKTRCNAEQIIFSNSRAGRCQAHSVLWATVHIWIIYEPDSVEKKLSKQDCISVVPKLFCLLAQETSSSYLAAHQSRKSIPINDDWHYLEITTSPGNNLRKSCDVARNGADLEKKSHYLPRPNLQCHPRLIAPVDHYFRAVFS